jgi:hypothetical protein
VPPRSRIGAHVVSVLVGLLLTPVALAALALGADAVASALGSGHSASPLAVAAAVLGALLLGVVALTGALSTLGPILGGALYGVVPGLGFLLDPTSIEDVTAALVEPSEAVLGDRLLGGALTLGRTGTLLALGLTLVLVGVAGHLARRAGRRAERAEALLAPEPYPTPGPQPGGAAPIVPPTPPRSRVRAHTVATTVAVVLTPVGLVLLAAGAVDLTVATADGLPPDLAHVLWPWGCGLVILCGVVLSAAWSTLGLLVAGSVFAVVPGLVGLFWPAWTDRGLGAFLTRVGELVDPDAAAGLYALATLGILLAWGAVATAGAAGVHGARRDGRRRERAEIAVARLTAARARS